LALLLASLFNDHFSMITSAIASGITFDQTLMAVLLALPLASFHSAGNLLLSVVTCIV